MAINGALVLTNVVYSIRIPGSALAGAGVSSKQRQVRPIAIQGFVFMLFGKQNVRRLEGPCAAPPGILPRFTALGPLPNTWLRQARDFASGGLQAGEKNDPLLAELGLWSSVSGEYLTLQMPSFTRI